MKILLITEYFSPISAVAAIRATKLAKYLSRRGHQVTVLCREWDEHVPADLNLQRDEKEVYKVLHVRNSPFFTAIADLAVSCADQAVPGSGTPPQTAEQTQAPGLLSRVIVQCSRWMEMQKSLNYACQAKKVLKRNCTEKFDVVISTYGPFSSHILGLYAKKKHGGCWIADYRDALLYVQGGEIISPWCRRLQKKVAVHADRITAVSEGCLSGMPEEGMKKAAVITNGFDLEDHTAGVAAPADGIFRLVYTGQMYAGKRDLQPVFKALKELAAEEKLDLEKVEIHYAGTNSAECFRQAAACGVEGRVIDHGYVTRDEALQLQGESNVLLLASWNNTGSTGIVTGKVFEYFMANKPIICTISGDLPGSILKQMICDANAGCCCEEAAKQEDFPKLKEELLRQYRIAMGEAENDFCLNQAYVYGFTYDHKAEEFARLFE